MKLHHALALASSCSAPAVLADFVTGSWLAPADLTSNSSHVRKAFGNITETLQAYILDDANGNLSTSAPEFIAGISNLTFSLGIFSLHDDSAPKLLQQYYTGPEIATAGNGTNTVDADSIYRVASVTKVLTTLSGLIKLPHKDWDRPLSDIFPVLLSYEKSHPGGPFAVNWTAKTLHRMAAQIRGVPRDGFPSLNDLELLNVLGEVETAPMGFPPVNFSDPLQNPPCVSYLMGGSNSSESAGGGSVGGDGSLCPAEPFLESRANRPPTFNPWTTPGYANNGFSLLGMALANLTNTTYEQLVQSAVFDPLNMMSSSIDTPPQSEWNRSVIADSSSPSTYFDIFAGVFAGSGAALSTLNDLARLGVGILRSTLLSAAETRRWLKPVSLPVVFSTPSARRGRSTATPCPTTKSSTCSPSRATRPHTALFSCFCRTTTSDLPFCPPRVLLSCASRFSLPLPMSSPTRSCLPSTPRLLSKRPGNFAGIYTLGNSSLRLIVNQTASNTPAPGGVLPGSGLVTANWTSNSTDVLASPFVTSSGPLPYRLVPSISEPCDRPSFHLLTPADEPSAQLPISSTLFSGSGFIRGDWVLVDSLTYGGIGTTLFQFELDSNGKATAVSPSAFRETLPKEE